MSGALPAVKPAMVFCSTPSLPPSKTRLTLLVGGSVFHWAPSLLMASSSASVYPCQSVTVVLPPAEPASDEPPEQAARPITMVATETRARDFRMVLGDNTTDGIGGS